MIKLSAKIRKEQGRKARVLKDAGRIPAIVYGHKVKNVMVDVDYKEFQKVYSQTGESSLIELDIEGESEKKIVFVHDYQKDAVSDQFIHIDFFETSAKEEVEELEVDKVDCAESAAEACPAQCIFIEK